LNSTPEDIDGGLIQKLRFEENPTREKIDTGMERKSDQGVTGSGWCLITAGGIGTHAASRGARGAFCRQHPGANPPSGRLADRPCLKKTDEIFAKS
jgi:hypothetical protein